MKYLILILFLVGCESYSPVPVKEKSDYKKTDIEDVAEAKATIKANSVKRKELIKKGSERAERFDPLLTSLIAFHNYGKELSLADVSPFIAELPHIASISTYEEKAEFIRLGTSSNISTKKAISEAEKGKGANEMVKKLERKVAELEEEKKSRVTDKTMSIAEKFFYLGAFLFAGSLFSSFSFIAPIAGSLKKGGIGLVVVGGAIMALGMLTDFLRGFLNDYGNYLLLLLLVPLILLFIGRKTDKAIDEIKDDANND